MILPLYRAGQYSDISSIGAQELQNDQLLLCPFKRQEVIEKKWSDLLTALEACKSTLSHYHDLMSVFSEMSDCLATMAQIEVLKESVYTIQDENDRPII